MTESPTSSPDRPISTTANYTRVIAMVSGVVIAFALVFGGGWLIKSTTSAPSSWPGSVSPENVSAWLENTTPSISISPEDVDTLTAVACEGYAADDREDNSVADAVGEAIAADSLSVESDAPDNERNVILTATAVSYRCPQYLAQEIK